MTADVLTKPLSGIKLNNCVRDLGLKDCYILFHKDYQN